MAISVSGLTVHTQNGGGSWQDWATGGGSGSTTATFLSGTSAQGRKFTGVKGFGFEVNAAGTDMRNTILVVRWLVNGGLASTKAAGGARIRIEDTSGNESDWYVDGSDTYTGGWREATIDTATAESGNSGTAANLQLIQYVGIVVDAAASSGGDPNVYVDEVLSLPNTGLTLSGNTTNLWDELYNWDDTSLYGIVQKRAGVVFVRCPVILSPDATGHASTDEVVVFEEPSYYDGSNTDSALTLTGITSADADPIEFTRDVIIAESNADINGTNADKEIDFVSAGDVTSDTTTWRGFDGTTLGLGGSGNTYTGDTFLGCGEITDTGSVMRECFFRNGVAAAGMYEWDEETDMEDCSFFGDGTGHSIHFTHNSATNLTGASGIPLTNINFSGGGATDTATSDIDMDTDTTTIDVDFNVSGGNTPTLDTRAPYAGTAQAINTVTVKVTVLDTSGTAIQDARVLLEADTGGDLAAGTDIVTGLTDVSGVIQNTGFSYTNPQPVTGRARKSSTPGSLYKTAPIIGTISSTGLDVTLQMIEDE